MSRALDPEITTSPTHSTPKEIYTSLSTILSPHPPTLLEIEFLGKSHPLPPGVHYLQDGNNIAIPKSALVQAWIYARHLFFSQLKPYLHSQQLQQEKEQMQECEEIWKATAIILLMDSEHLTAANTRKKLLMLQRKVLEKSVFVEKLNTELLFVDSYLTARLHRHTKSPTLWSHRRWLLEVFKEEGVVWGRGGDLDVVLVAAERHPRNYYAWLHLRWLVRNWEGGLESGGGEGVLERVKMWCLKHPGDTSGFSFLGFYLEYLIALNVLREGQDQRQVVVREVLGLTRSFKWTHESVWVFLRTLVAASGDEESIAAFIEVNTLLAEVSREDWKATKVLESAIQWYEQNKRT